MGQRSDKEARLAELEAKRQVDEVVLQGLGQQEADHQVSESS